MSSSGEDGRGSGKEFSIGSAEEIVPVEQGDTPLKAETTVNSSKIGKNNVRDSTICAGKSKENWAKSLSEKGAEGLVFKALPVLMNPTEDPAHTGISLRYWTEAVINATASIAQRESKFSSGMDGAVYTLHDNLPPQTSLGSAISTITSVIEQADGEKITTSVPQLVVASNGGYSWDYVLDRVSPAYRCFLFMGTEYTDLLRDSIFESNDSYRYVHAFVSKADSETLYKYGTESVITMTQLFHESQLKFRMHVGDVLIMKGCHPFAVDLPILEKSVKTRMLTWALFHRGVENPKVIPVPTRVTMIEEIISKDTRAMEYYNKEMDMLKGEKQDERDIGELDAFMERVRVTPRIYEATEVLDRVALSKNIVDISDWLRV